MGRTLLVVPDADRVEQCLEDAAASADFVDARDVCTLSEVVDRCEPARWSRRAPADALTVRLLIAAHAPALASPAWGAWASSVDFAVETQELLAQLRGQAATPRQLRAAALAASGGLHERAGALASLWEAVDGALDALGLVDPGELMRLAASRLAKDGLPPRLLGFEAFVVRHVHELSLGRLQLLEALAGACQRSHRRLELHWPSSGEPRADVFVLDAVRTIEARWQSLDVEAFPEPSDAPLAWVAGAAVGEPGPPREAPGLTSFAAPTPRGEARAIASRVRALLASGTPPERVAVAFRDLADDASALVEAFDALEIPLRAHLPRPFLSTSVGRLALSLFELIDERFPADALASLLESRGVRLLPPQAARPRLAFLEAGVRDDELGATAEAGAYQVRLTELLERTADEPRRAALAALRTSVGEALGLLGSLPERAPAGALAQAYFEVLSRLGLLPTALERVPAPRAKDERLEARLDRALALDEAASQALDGLMASLKAALELSGLWGRSMSRRDFGRHVRRAASTLQLPTRGPRAGAVWLLDVRALAGRRFEALFLGGLVDGRFPGRPAPLGLLDEEDRRSLNRLAGAPLFRSSVADGDVWLPARLAEDRLLLHLALCAADRVTLSRARFDGAGKELLPSPFLDAISRCVAGFQEQVLPQRPVPALDEVRTELELRARVALEGLSPPATRQTAGDPRGHALLALLDGERWLEEARHVQAVETERVRFFSDEGRAAGPYSGQLGHALLGPLGARLEYGRQRPLSAAELGQWGQCAFRGLLLNVLELDTPQLAREEPDGRTRGTFLHDVLFEVVPELERLGWLGKVDLAPEDAAAVVERAATAAGARLVRRASTGHPALWELGRARAAAIVRRLVMEPEVIRPFSAMRVLEAEVLFGSPRALPELREVRLPAVGDGEREVFIRGRIDRVDAGDGCAGVIDYKSSSAAKKQRAGELLASDFQLPFYLLAVRQWLPGRALEGAWLALREREARSLAEVLGALEVSVVELLATDEVTRGQLAADARPNLANAVHGLLGRLRQGDFGPRPRDCRFCAMRPVCRISERRLAPEGD
jgi:hypothetical protein